jgi:DNA-binding beta-propeller fold protein YncE
VLRPNLLIRVLPAILLAAPTVTAQTTGATFGEVIALGGTPSDLVLDELRGRIYIINDKAHRVDVYDYHQNAVVGSIPVGRRPLAGAISMDGAYLYVTNNESSTLSIIDLANLQSSSVLLPYRPEGVEAGADGRVLIAMVGTGTANNVQGTLAVYDRNATSQVQPVQLVQVPALPATPAPLPPTTIPARPQVTFTGRLIRTPDGRFIVGVVTPTANSYYMFVYEVASGVILRNRTVQGQSSVLAMSADGSTFMAGMTLYNTLTLAVIGQASNSNAPYPSFGNFQAGNNIGGSAFSADGQTLYSAFNVTPFANPQPRPQASTLLISDPRNLRIKLGIKMPESIVAKMLVTSDGSRAWGMSESGMLHLPLGKLYDYPILQPESTHVFLSLNPCNQGLATGEVRINNLGKGRLTFSVPNTGAALVAIAESGLAPAKIRFIMEPGRSGVQRRPGTNIWTSAGTFSGTAFSVNLASTEAINLIPTIRVYMNYRQPDQRGMIFPIATGPNVAEGLPDLLLDEPRNRLYIVNTSFNRIEVFDTLKQRLLEPIPVGQLPRQMAMGFDGTTMYVANQGGESISIVDLDLGRVIGDVEFPPTPRSGTAGLIFTRGIAMGYFGLQVIMSNGSLWKVVGNQAVPRPASTVITQTVSPNAVSTSTSVNIPGAAHNMIQTSDGEYIVVLGGNGHGFLYDSKIDQFTAGRLLFTNPIRGYFGPLGAGQGGQFYLLNGLISNSSLTVVGGAERAGGTQFQQPPQPGLPPVQTIVNTGQRHVAAIAPLGESSFLRMTMPVRQNITAATRDDERPTLETIDLVSGTETLAAVAPENPTFTVLGTGRSNVAARQMVVDSKGMAYALTLSGLSVIPLPQATGMAPPAIASGARGIVNSSDGTPNIRPGSFVTISGTNLAAPATGDQLPVPTVLGGSCVVFSDVAVPLLQTSSGQIQAQVPDTLRPGTYVVQVKSLATAQASDPMIVTVQRPAGESSSEPPRPSTEPPAPQPEPDPEPPAPEVQPPDNPEPAPEEAEDPPPDSEP